MHYSSIIAGTAYNGFYLEILYTASNVIYNKLMWKLFAAGIFVKVI